MAAACIFCKIIRGEIPSLKLFESDKILAFLDIQPLSRGHALREVLPVVKRLVTATGAENYNVLQNNGRLAHQEVDHVHFHMIPKPDAKQGLGIEWPATAPDKEKLKELLAELKAKM
ncbi:MAG: Adenosine 5'-monophosphoramidase [Thelocarpon superellum]|nr:MAG: Adenosine 5'-monophosphoramidase [Thelocarpon superellum]